MPDRAAVLAAIDDAYAARKRGDKEALAAHFAIGATFRLIGRSDLLGFDVGPADAMLAIGSLIDTFVFHAMERLRVVIAGDTAVIHWRIETSVRGSDEREVSELCDIWTFDDEMKATAIVEFADTALISHMTGATA